jgi:ferredoxin
VNVIVEEGKCVGSGQCVLVAPGVFDQRDSDGVVVLLDATPPESVWANVREAVILCPAAVVRIRETPRP